MKKERVELSVHTKMSRMDAVASAGDYVRAAAEQGQPAIAVTDHGCAQAFPEAMRAAEQCKKEGRSIKIYMAWRRTAQTVGMPRRTM